MRRRLEDVVDFIAEASGLLVLAFIFILPIASAALWGPR